MRILLVEDHPSLGDSLRRAFANDAYSVDWVTTLAEAEAGIAVADYHLVLLDLGLPDGNGLDFLHRLRRDGRTMPVLVLTARGELNDRVDGLDSGADDYLVKPFAIEELRSRCRALLRRPSDLVQPREQVGNLSFDFNASAVFVNEAPVAIARRELQLLRALIQRAGAVCSRRYLDNQLYDFESDASRNALEASMSRLRGILKANGATATVRTIRGVGYVLERGEDA
ncbi:response regulator [Acuticoccus sp. M5D2P5]|uniref:response regulator n=1 Tax=Acuticoccus kalidii TaxID=2910977 RepID=UPI001F27C7DC|nr:response regulator [Acuticoccus kalidii]MCF3932059.1 response regulator [Acuticoccus kalidii]